MENLHPQVSPFLDKVSKGTTMARKTSRVISAIVVKPLEWLHKGYNLAANIIRSKKKII